jgi:predicted NBD/HSP70 family sugar kinase
MRGRGLQERSKKNVCQDVRYGPAPLPPRLKRESVTPLVKTGWLMGLEDGSFELGPSCGLILSIVALRESLQCAVVRPDGRLIPRDDGSTLFETTEVPLVPRVPIIEENVGITPQGFVIKLASLVKRSLKQRRRVSNVGFSAVSIAWPGRIDRRVRAEGGKPLGDVYSYEQKTYGGWTVGEDEPVSLAGLIGEALERAGFGKRKPPVLVINDADAELLALANIPLDDRTPTEEELKDGGPAVRARDVHERIGASNIAIGITVAGGVGGALLVEGVLTRGQHGLVGELGEVPVDIKHAHIKKGKTSGLESLDRLKKNKRYPRWTFPHEETLDYWASARSILDQLYLAEQPESKYKNEDTYTAELPIATNPSDPEIRTAILKRAGRLIGLGIIGPILMLDPGVVLVSSRLPSKPIVDGIADLLEEEIGEMDLDSDLILAVDEDSARLLKGTARWAIGEIVDPALDAVCKASNHKLAEIELELTRWPRS